MNTLSDIALFVEVARHKSYTHASEQLEIPTSTLSRRISALETTIGIKLLNRSSRRVSLTESGERYFDYCHQLVTDLNMAHEMMHTEKKTPKGKLRITAPDIAVHYLAPAIANFSKDYPDISFELDINPNLIDLVSDNFDIALRIGQLDDSNLVAYKLFDQTQMLYASPNYVKNHPKITIDTINQHPLIRIWTKNKSKSITLFNQDKTIEIGNNSFISVNNMELIANLTALDAGIGLITNIFADTLTQEGKLIPICPEWYSNKVPFSAVVTSRHLPAKTRLFIEYLKNIKTQNTINPEI